MPRPGRGPTPSAGARPLPRPSSAGSESERRITYSVVDWLQKEGWAHVFPEVSIQRGIIQGGVDVAAADATFSRTIAVEVKQDWRRGDAETQLRDAQHAADLAYLAAPPGFSAKVRVPDGVGVLEVLPWQPGGPTRESIHVLRPAQLGRPTGDARRVFVHGLVREARKRGRFGALGGRCPACGRTECDVWGGIGSGVAIDPSSAPGTTFNGGKMPIVFCPAFQSNAPTVAGIAQALEGHGFEPEVLAWPGLEGRGGVFTLEAAALAAEAAVEAATRNWPGPVGLVGYSAGGWAALRAAAKLSQGFLVLIDPVVDIGVLARDLGFGVLSSEVSQWVRKARGNPEPVLAELNDAFRGRLRSAPARVMVPVLLVSGHEWLGAAGQAKALKQITGKLRRRAFDEGHFFDGRHGQIGTEIATFVGAAVKRQRKVVTRRPPS